MGSRGEHAVWFLFALSFCATNFDVSRIATHKWSGPYQSLISK